MLSLPFKVNKVKVADNRSLAFKSLLKLEKTLEPELKMRYVNFIREYVGIGHASLAKPKNGPCYYIPHRVVVREESLTTPVHVVFNASSKQKGEISLNDALTVGPQIQRELSDILIAVRSYQFVFSADVKKMYRMIWIQEQDRDMQHILWRESPDEPICEYQLNTVSYGTRPASFMAMQCLEVIVRNIVREYPEVARLVRMNFYMDDLVAGGDNLEELCRHRKILYDILSNNGFRLRKYCANAQKIVSDIPLELVLNGSNLELAENAAILGVV